MKQIFTTTLLFLGSVFCFSQSKLPVDIKYGQEVKESKMSVVTGYIGTDGENYFFARTQAKLIYLVVTYFVTLPSIQRWLNILFVIYS